MFKLSLIAAIFLASFNVIAQTSPHGKSLNIKCEVCHTPNGWRYRATTFDHSQTGFALDGQHKTVDCRKCHVDLVFKNAKTDCNSCHKDVHQQTVGQDCRRCHTTQTWVVNNIKEIHRQTRFPLNGGHATADCYSCHKSASRLRFEPMNTECVSCHQKDYNATTNPSHRASKFPTNCTMCHTDKSWQKATFDHNTNTNFPLKNAHLGLECSRCHTSGYRQISTACVSCHQKDYNATVSPAHAPAKFSTECLSCHNDMSWKPSTFKHDVNTSFKLNGSHKGVDCISCHKNGQFAGTASTCVSCHKSNFDATTNPNHSLGKFSTDCQTCHNENVWNPSTFKHDVNTSFKLNGSHKGVDCISCHKNGQFAGTASTCVSCHKSNFDATTNPNHTLAKFSTDCKSCHNENAWKPSSFNHNTATSFPLKSSHIGVDCVSCHKTTFAGTASACVDCHLTNYNATTNPNHVTSKFPKDCQLCHSETTWQSATFDHNTTNFPLKGSHSGLDCVKCHANGYAGTPTTCVSCHQANFNATVNPSHTAAKFSTDCQSCHNENSWKPSTFNHDVNTAFKLNGSHKGVDCISCHKNGQFAGTASTCVSCHKSNFDATTNPNHTLAKFSTDCQSCHNENAWKPSSFNHNTATSFPLKSSHIGVDCVSCHKTTFAGTASACVDCHLTNYNATTNPNHVTSKFPKDCQLCHTETTWQSATFDHNTTNFPLKGSHSGLDCAKCHANGYAGTPTTCVSCHQANFNATVNPSHTAAKFSTDCQSCHNETAWKPSTFNHNTATSFLLKGSHTTVDCIGCHSGGFAGTSKNCVDCHLANYNATTNPNHVTAKFAKECQTCHNETAWKPSTFNHSTATSFPLKGKHVGVDCISCHKNGYAGISTACSSCHMTDFNSTTNPNHVTSKFATTCETCHTVNGWTPSTFNHANYFPITSGRHNVACTICHTNSANYAQFTCLTASCHPKSSTDSDHRGESGYVYNSANCYSCHPTGKGD